MANSNLHDAKKAKQDEFYTQWADIEKEMNAYVDYGPDVFRGKTVLLPCDDPEWSNFTRFFVHNFTAFGIKKLISTSYTPRGNGHIFVMESGSKSDDSIEWECLDGDGDFRSDEVTKLRDEADVVVTNPPFSLFREFVSWLVEGDVKFSVIGNMNAITYKEIFPLIKDNEMWPGTTFNKTMEFAVPADYYAAKDAELDKYGNRLVKVPAIAWFTNIEHGRRHEPLVLMTMEDNLVYGSKKVRSAGYPKYDNYDAIEVPETNSIPSDHDGMMGVPISFLDKYSPEQFEILGITQSWDDLSGLKVRQYPTQLQVSKTGKESRVGKLNDAAAIPVKTHPKGGTYYRVGEELFVKPYCRILIRHRRPETKEHNQ